MAQFATVDELADLLRQTLEPDDPGAILALETASAEIQNEARQTFELVENETIELMGIWGRYLYLPERPVTAIGSVTIGDGPALTSTAYVWNSYGRLSQSPLGHWGGPDEVVAIQYSHGYPPDEIPNDIRGITLQLAARIFGNPTTIQAERVGSYSVSYALELAGIGLTDSERRQLSRYRPRSFSVRIGGRAS